MKTDSSEVDTIRIVGRRYLSCEHGSWSMSPRKCYIDRLLAKQTRQRTKECLFNLRLSRHRSLFNRLTPFNRNLTTAHTVFILTKLWARNVQTEG